ncbi:MAG: amidohydrolase [Pseudanabaenaceae cyanobacterium bins.68]|nr:amidohydrolase [Pseudanabaenaceae cyanobacterium bins.68]
MIKTLPPHLAVRPAIQALQPQLVQWRRQIHRLPELGFQEHRTNALIVSQLQAWGIPFVAGVAKTGIVATIQGKAKSSNRSSNCDSLVPLARPQHPVLAIRADLDALPIQEQNITDYRSQIDGLMHACGHDGHVAIALGTAAYLWQNRDRLAGTIKIIFQPAEEGPGGAKPMIEAGVLDGVDAIIGLHLWNNLPLGTVGLRSGALMAAVDLFDCSIYGRGGHGAMPHQTVDAIVVAAQVVNSLQTIVARNLDPLESGVVSIGKFQAGKAPNVIADQANLSGTVRYFSPRLARLLPERLEQVIAGVCRSQGATYALDYRHIYPAVINHPAITNLVKQAAQTVVETDLAIVPECQTMGGEDMSYFLQQVPGCYFFLGSANPALNLDFPHHHPKFDFDETALSAGVEIFVRCAETFCS